MGGAASGPARTSLSRGKAHHESPHVVHDFTQPLSIEDVPGPEPNGGQVLVRIEACGLCHTDIARGARRLADQAAAACR
jgi:hypothetical protein